MATSATSRPPKAMANGGPKRLAVAIGQHSDKGAKAENQDFHGAIIPEGTAMATKGIAIAIADGISTSKVSALASQTAVKSFLSDYYATSDAWSVKTAGERVIGAANGWLHSQNDRMLTDEERDGGHVCGFSALVLKSRLAHIFHVGDAQVARIGGGAVEPLTRQHRVWVNSRVSYLARALGADRFVEIDYRSEAVQVGDLFMLSTDGVYEHLSEGELLAILADTPGDLDAAARQMCEQARANGSGDNLTAQLVRIEALPDGDADEIMAEADALAPLPDLRAGEPFEGFDIIRPLHRNARSHIFLARDRASGALVALKTLSTEMRADAGQLRRFMLEEWIARRIHNPHVLKAATLPRPREHLYVATEYVDGISLAQWMEDNPRPELETVRKIVEQIGAGLQAFHRREMLHQDMRPQNVMIDGEGTAKIIDFGAAWVAGVAEAGIGGVEPDEALGTLQYMAPEYLLGERGDARSDMFSLGVIAYQMLTGALPFGARRADIACAADLRKLRYVSARDHVADIPDWVDAALARAMHPERARRYDELSEFLYDLRHPNPRLSAPEQRPPLQRDQVLRWKFVAALLAALALALAVQNYSLTHPSTPSPTAAEKENAP